MINDVTDAFGDWLTTYAVKRPPAGTYNSAGDWVAGASASFNISAVIQNANPEDLKVLTEGQRTNEAIKIHTVTELIIQTTNQTGDLIVYEGSDWLVYNVADRKIGNYYKAIATRQKR